MGFEQIKNIGLICASLILVAIGCKKKYELVSSTRPNVIIVMTDDQGYGDLSVHGNPILKTPYLDKIHSESVRLTDFHVTPVCSPTRGELMSGRTALNNGCHNVVSSWSMIWEELVSYWEHLRRMAMQRVSLANGTLLFSEKYTAAILWKKWRLVWGNELYNLESDPGQQNDMASEHPEIVEKLRNYYEGYWDKVSPEFTRPHYISVGTPFENPVLLSFHDWAASHTASYSYIWKGKKESGPFYVDIKSPGKYEVSLRRWPSETHLALTDSMPPFEGELGTFGGGKTLLIDSARLKIGDQKWAAKVDPTAEKVTFEVELTKGRTQLQSWFYDPDGQFLCGAYYMEVLR